MARGDHSTPEQLHERALRRARVVELREAGLTFPQVAEDIGISVGTAWNYFQQAMREIPAPFVAAAAEQEAARRAEQLARIDMEREVLMGILEAEHVTVSNGKVIPDVIDHGPNMAAVDRLHKLDNQEAELLGLKAEQKLNLSGGVRYELVGIDPADLT